MRIFFSISLLLICNISTNCQDEFECLMDDSPAQYKATTCHHWDHYKSTNISATPTKTIRITFHIFNDNSGSGNVQNDTYGLLFIDDYMNWLNKKLRQLVPMRVPTSSPYITDSRVQYELAETHFWNNTTGYTYPGYHDQAWSNSLYTQFVTNQPSVTYKTNSVHVFMPGGSISQGWASDFGDKDYVVLAGNYPKYLSWLIDYLPDGIGWVSTGGLAHELGHSMGLYHTWVYDDIADTPSNNDCWNLNDPAGVDCDEWEEVSNNIMDYNAARSAYTLGQLHKAHYVLQGNIGTMNIEDCLIGSITTQTPTISGTDLVCDEGVEFQFQNIQLGVEILTSTSTNITASDCGEEVSFTPTTYTSSPESGSITFTFDYGSSGTTQTVKNVSVVGYQYEIRNICDLSSTSSISAKIINLPDPSCSTTDAVVDNGNSLSIICEEITINAGFEVELGGTLDIQTFVCE